MACLSLTLYTIVATRMQGRDSVILGGTSGVYVGIESITPAKEYPVPDVYTPKNLIIKTKSCAMFAIF